MQFSGIHSGICSATFLFSYLVVPPSNIPLSFPKKALTGKLSPLSKLIVSLKFNFLPSLTSRLIHSLSTLISFKIQ